MLKWFKKKDVPSAPSGSPTGIEDPPDPRAGGGGVFTRLRKGLSRTQVALVDNMRAAIGLKDKVDEELLENIEEVLIRGDVGARSAARIVDRLRSEGRKREACDPDALTAIVKESILEILSKGQRPFAHDAPTPFVVLVVGVNGTGKTTTIGKMALEMTRAGKRVMLVAADTFRAAAVEQLAIWAERTGSCLVSKEGGADPASVCYEALDAAKNDPPDAIFIDTAGRLHTKTYLMEELGKVIRVIKKVQPGAPHETILVLDATTGQNALNQVDTFLEVAELTGLVMTKLDGTAKGGILIAIKDAHEDLPIFKIGIGEAAEDLRDFNAEEFADALFANTN